MTSGECGYRFQWNTINWEFVWRNAIHLNAPIINRREIERKIFVLLNKSERFVIEFFAETFKNNAAVSSARTEKEIDMKKQSE